MKIGERIKKLRIKNDFTLDELAEKMQTTKQTIYKYENNIVTNIPSDKIEKLATIFNVTPAYLMGWTDCEFEIENKPDALIENYEENARYILDHEDKELLKAYKDLIRDENLVLLVKKASKLSPEDVVQLLKIVNTFDVSEDE